MYIPEIQIVKTAYTNNFEVLEVTRSGKHHICYFSLNVKKREVNLNVAMIPHQYQKFLTQSINKYAQRYFNS